MKQTIVIDGKRYRIEVIRRTRLGRDAVSIVMANHNTLDLARAAIESVRKWTTIPYELWVVDNFSDPAVVNYLKDQPDLNLILNRTPVGGWTWRRWHGIPFPAPPDRTTWSRIPYGGSLCNGVALEMASHVVETDYVFVMHNDILVGPGWLEFLLSKLTERVRGAAVSFDPARLHAMHQSGFLVDFRLFHPLKMSFLPKLPEYDVGDLVTIRLREAGFDTYICKNTFNHPETLAWITDEALRAMYCVRAFNDDREVIYLHLGRGTSKTAGTYRQQGKTTAERWLQYAQEHVRGAQSMVVNAREECMTRGGIHR